MSHSSTPPVDDNRLRFAPERGSGGGAPSAGAPEADKATAGGPVAPPVDEPQARRWWQRLLVDDSERTSGWLSSLLFHTTVLLLLALMVHHYVPTSTGPKLTSLLSDDVPAIDEAPSVTGELDMPSPDVTAETTLLDLPDTEIQLESTQPRSTDQPSAEATADTSNEAAGDGGADVSYLLAGRSADARAKLVRTRGGTPGSEAAVERGLRWLAAHQLDSGGWNFNHNLSRCAGQCRNPGSVTTTTGATSIALLAYLGSGNTHLEGDYTDVVRRGLYYLANRATTDMHGADFQEGTMYAQGLSAITLCEASAMTEDKRLAKLGQQAIDFIAYAQDDNGGGWRYFPNSIGDTSVTGWQLMALKSGHIAGLEVPRSCFYGARHFLDSMSVENGSQYRYQSDRSATASMTAVGLLCRMYLGWRHDDPRLKAGVEYLADLGPSDTDMYYNYYATQVLSHYGGSLWKTWNPAMRDYLVNTQASQGHESGSWYFVDEHATSAGRLYNTAMAVMTLEVYYRYMPLYGEKAVGE